MNKNIIMKNKIYCKFIEFLIKIHILNHKAYYKLLGKSDIELIGIVLKDEEI